MKFKKFFKLLWKYICIIIFIICSFYSSSSLFSNDQMKNKIIFTFWEPRKHIPGYLKLCMKTWKKYLPGYNIKILDYEIVKGYLGEHLYKSIICEKMEMKVQADAIRDAMLKKYGGLWMDADNIILNGEFIKNLENNELVMFGDEKYKSQDIGFIYASTNSSILEQWFKEIIKNVEYYRHIISNKNKYSDYIIQRVTNWSYLGNGIIDKLIINATKKQFFRIDKNIINTYPERNIFKNSNLSYPKKYCQFYFKKRDFRGIFNSTKDIILLHNSWTPRKYKCMSEKEFLEKDILLSKLLSFIINRK